MTEGEILSGIRAREGDGVKNDPNDPQDPSKFGIGAVTLGNWRTLGRRATLEEMVALEWSEAEAIYATIYIADPGFTPEHVPFEPLRVQLIDFGVTSGPPRAIRWLQRVLQMPKHLYTGTLDERTLSVLREYADDVLLPLVNDALVAARLYMLDTLTDSRPGYKKYEEGLESRALTFFLSKD